MDLFSLSYQIQRSRYRVSPDLVAEAIMLWHRRSESKSVSPTVLEP